MKSTLMNHQSSANASLNMHAALSGEVKDGIMQESFT